MELEKLYNAMNEDVGFLYASAEQYKQHAVLLQGTHTLLASDLLEHANDDLQQAQELSEKLAFYGHTPGSVRKRPKLFNNSGDPSIDMLIADMGTISSAISRFNVNLSIARQCSMPAIELIYMEMIRHEEAHLDTFQSYLFPYLAEMAEQGEDFTDMAMAKRASKLRNLR